MTEEPTTTGGAQDSGHDGTAVFLRATYGRRTALKLLAGAGAVALVGCGDDDDAGTTSAATSDTVDSATTTGSSSNGTTATSAQTGSSAASTSAETTCTEIPEETAGPYPGDGSNGPNVLTEDGVVRSDITSSFGSSTTTAEGVPLTVTLTLVDTANGCTPLAGAAVYLWHCDAEGRYSLYSEGATEENYLRGVQEADDSGVVTFMSIFPAAYMGRWPHIHFEVFASLADATSGGDVLTTSQLAFPEEVCDTVYTTDGYSASVQNMSQTSLESDNVFGDDEASDQLADVTGSVDEGYVASLVVGV